MNNYFLKAQELSVSKLFQKVKTKNKYNVIHKDYEKLSNTTRCCY